VRVCLAGCARHAAEPHARSADGAVAGGDGVAYVRAGAGVRHTAGCATSTQRGQGREQRRRLGPDAAGGLWQLPARGSEAAWVEGDTKAG
jgi:hypothetical protein